MEALLHFLESGGEGRQMLIATHDQELLERIRTWNAANAAFYRVFKNAENECHIETI